MNNLFKNNYLLEKFLINKLINIFGFFKLFIYKIYENHLFTYYSG